MKKLSLVFISAMMAAGVYAQNIPGIFGPSEGDLKFNGSINETCNLQNFKDGTVVANINQTVMSSTLSGGTPAFVNIRVNANGYSLVLGNPTLIGPNGIEQDVSIALSPVGNGTNLVGVARSQFTATNGRMSFDSGLYGIVINGEATKNTGAFDAGIYVIRVPITCVKVS